MSVLLSLSGGIDSATLLGYFTNTDRKVTAVSFYYGSKHNKYENQAAKKIADHYNIELIELDISQAMSNIKSNLLLSGGDIPEGHYQSENMKQTVVPARNMIFISILAGIAESRGIASLAVGVHSGDHAIYCDCRPAFIQSMSEAVSAGTGGKVMGVQAPFILMDKSQIIQIGSDHLKIPVPYNLTRTCYKDQELACGVCGSCIERLEAFKNNGLKDPIEYATKRINNHV